MTSAPRLTFKEMCAEFDVTPRTLRYYEYIELLSPERDGRARYYHAREIGRMKLIMRGRRFGMPLEEIRQWLEMYNSDPQNRAQMQAVVDFADKQILELEDQKKQLEEAIHDLKALRAHVLKEL